MAFQKSLIFSQACAALDWGRKSENLSSEGLRPKSTSAQSTAQAVEGFLTEDTNSVVSPGKKEFCYKGQKQKIRYMTDSLVGLHEKFVASSQIRLSYAQFTRLKPPYIKKPKVTARDTCACKRCENYKLLATAAYKAGLTSQPTGRDLVASLCAYVVSQKLISVWPESVLNVLKSLFCIVTLTLLLMCLFISGKLLKNPLSLRIRPIKHVRTMIILMKNVNPKPRIRL